MTWPTSKLSWLCLAALLLIRLPAVADDTNEIKHSWSLELGVGFNLSSPAIAPDGTIYQGTFIGRMLAISPEGRVQWNYRIGHEIKSSPAIGSDGTIYFGCRDRNFYALTPAGKLKWKFATGAWVDSSPGIGMDGTLYFGSWDKSFYALTPDGQLKWKFATSNLITVSPAIAADGTIYFGSHDKYFYALAPDGTSKWKFLTGAEIDASPAIGADGTVYFSSTDGNLYALHPDGTEAWRLRTGGYTESSPVLDHEGNLYLAANRSHISVSPDGKLRWQHMVEVPLDMSELVTRDNWIYGSVPWLHLGFSDRIGNSHWGYQLRFNLSTSPNISTNGIIYAVDEAQLHALQPSSPTVLEKSAWPMWRADPQHTGRVQK
ncbi:MAG TPA: PQQ-binding-like beta-propeller repeat protein [Verrucomicrobiae bacterium]|nr:PQQ-binding-like beta-propeller repeat protein [Verrucomicrobiae bacterium]